MRIVILLGMLALVAGCSGGDAGGMAGQGNSGGDGPRRPALPPVPVAVADATVGTIASYYRATASLEAEKLATVLCRAEGLVSQLLVEEGDRVPAGERSCASATTSTGSASSRPRRAPPSSARPSSA